MKFDGRDCLVGPICLVLVDKIRSSTKWLSDSLISDEPYKTEVEDHLVDVVVEEEAEVR